MLKCEQCGKQRNGLLDGLCGWCLRARAHVREQLLAGKAAPSGYVLAGADLPLREVFSQAEMPRLLFARHLVSIGILHEGV